MPASIAAQRYCIAESPSPSDRSPQSELAAVQDDYASPGAEHATECTIAETEEKDIHTETTQSSSPSSSSSYSSPASSTPSSPTSSCADTYHWEDWEQHSHFTGVRALFRSLVLHSMRETCMLGCDLQARRNRVSRHSFFTFFSFAVALRH